MEEALQRFHAWLEAQDRSPRTVQAYLSDLAHFARWFAQTNGQPFSPEAITPTDVRECRKWMVAVQGLTPATVNRRIAALRAFATWAYEAGLVAGDPTEGVRLLTEQPRPPRWLDRRQQAALRRTLERRLEHAELKAHLARLQGRPVPPELVWARRDAALVHLMLNAGPRAAEVMASEVGDVVLRECHLSGCTGSMRFHPYWATRFRPSWANPFHPRCSTCFRPKGAIGTLAQILSIGHTWR
ncbi:MAG TPA: hypothetical protein ENI37_08100 [Chloroflexi bacterium]|nr:hypothetical protein [Chloroflexota bacterium]